jgi:hypothetical protein
LKEVSKVSIFGKIFGGSGVEWRGEERRGIDIYILVGLAYCVLEVIYNTKGNAYI